MSWLTLKGDRIYFKPLDKSILHDLHKYASNEDVSRFIGWPLTKSLEESESYLNKLFNNEKNKTHEYASIMLGEKHIGTMMLFNFNREAKNVEIGYVLSKEHWHKGYTGEAVTLLMDYLKAHTDTHKIYARVVSTNIGSSKVLENYGFKLEGYQVDQYFIENKYYDALHYGYII